MVDGHITEQNTQGDNYHLDLDGILFLGNYGGSHIMFSKVLKNHILQKRLKCDYVTIFQVEQNPNSTTHCQLRSYQGQVFKDAYQASKRMEN